MELLNIMNMILGALIKPEQIYFPDLSSDKLSRSALFKTALNSSLIFGIKVFYQLRHDEFFLGNFSTDFATFLFHQRLRNLFMRWHFAAQKRKKTAESSFQFKTRLQIYST